MKTQPTPEQERVSDDLLDIEKHCPKMTAAICVGYAQACALDRIAQSIEHFANVVEKATKEHS